LSSEEPTDPATHAAFYKLSHIGREEALRQQPEEESRRALQATGRGLKDGDGTMRAAAVEDEDD